MTRSAANRRWIRRPGAPLVSELPGLPPLIAGLVGAQGFVSAAASEAYLRADLDRDHDPLLLPQIMPALERIAAAIRADELIAVFGDFDVDGVTGTAILVEGITALGGKVIPYLPDRFDEGYGVNAPALTALQQQGVSLVITVDCGISADKEVDYANEIGLDVIVVDHHTIPACLPDALALIDPKLEGCTYPCTELAACGVAFKVLIALADHLGRAYDPEQHMDLVALGTVCDMAPLQGENRYFVRKGLRSLSRTGRPGLWALAEVSRSDLRQVDAEMLGFRLGPRLNAAGRIEHAKLAYELVTTRDQQQARVLAEKLDALNTRRQILTRVGVDLAEQMLADLPSETRLLMVGHAQIHQGIVGLVAGRLAEKHQKPSLVYQILPGECKGSARSIPSFDIVAALQQASPLLTRFGGHRQAGGFTVAVENVGRLRDFLTAYAAEKLAGSDPTPILEYDAEIDLDSLTTEERRWLPFLAPHGLGNPEPVFVSRGLTIAERRVVGADSTHLQLRLRSAGTIHKGIAFGLASAAPGLGERIDIAFVLRKDERSGRPDLHVRDFAPSA